MASFTRAQAATSCRRHVSFMLESFLQWLQAASPGCQYAMLLGSGHGHCSKACQASDPEARACVWRSGKEYAKADSRYASRDSFTISMEFVTAFVEGPGCFFILYGIAQRSSWRFTLQLMVSLGELYGDVLYFGTCFLEGASGITGM